MQAAQRHCLEVGETENFQLGSIPQSLLEEATQRLRVFSTALGWAGNHVGGGTFVRVNGRSGILTAGHVWDALYNNRRDQPNVTMVVRDGLHSYSLPVEYFVPHIDVKRNSEAFGPDIQFLELPPDTVSRICAQKSFAEISDNADRWLPLALAEEGFGAVMGFAAEQTRKIELGQNEILLELRGGYISGIEQHQRIGDFDYVETIADPINAKGLPSTYGGVSGAGLWRVPINKKLREPLTAATMSEKFVFAGVAFYEEHMADGRMKIRYHGPETVYRRVPRLVPKR